MDYSSPIFIPIPFHLPQHRPILNDPMQRSCGLPHLERDLSLHTQVDKNTTLFIHVTVQALPGRPTMQVRRIQKSVLGLLLLVGLSACSGGGDTPAPAPTPSPAASAEGLWYGATNTIPSRTVTGVVLDDGVYWFLYSVAGDSSIIAGVVQGDSSSQDGVLNSSNTTDFSIERTPLILNPTVDGSYTMKQSLSGTISYSNPNTQNSFTTTYDSNYELAPDITAVAGTYIGPVSLNETVEVTVSPNGDITGHSISGPPATQCTFIGSFKPRTHGNVFDVTITFGGQASCSNGNGTVNGVGVFHAGKLYSAALNSGKTNGVVFIGTKQ